MVNLTTASQFLKNAAPKAIIKKLTIMPLRMSMVHIRIRIQSKSPTSNKITTIYGNIFSPPRNLDYAIN